MGISRILTSVLTPTDVKLGLSLLVGEVGVKPRDEAGFQPHPLSNDIYICRYPDSCCHLILVAMVFFFCRPNMQSLLSSLSLAAA
jgi:hypothetical protein